MESKYLKYKRKNYTFQYISEILAHFEHKFADILLKFQIKK